MPCVTLQQENHNMDLWCLTKAILSEAASYTLFENKQTKKQLLTWHRALEETEHTDHRIPSDSAAQTAHHELCYTGPVVS